MVALAATVSQTIILQQGKPPLESYAAVITLDGSKQPNKVTFAFDGQEVSSTGTEGGTQWSVSNNVAIGGAATSVEVKIEFVDGSPVEVVVIGAPFAVYAKDWGSIIHWAWGRPA